MGISAGYERFFQSFFHALEDRDGGGVTIHGDAFDGVSRRARASGESVSRGWVDFGGVLSGGTASNVVTYLAQASVAEDVVLTTVSTFMATVMTPTLTQHLAGTMIPVDGVGLFLST